MVRRFLHIFGIQTCFTKQQFHYMKSFNRVTRETPVNTVSTLVSYMGLSSFQRFEIWPRGFPSILHRTKFLTIPMHFTNIFLFSWDNLYKFEFRYMENTFSRVEPQAEVLDCNILPLSSQISQTDLVFTKTKSIHKFPSTDSTNSLSLNILASRPLSYFTNGSDRLRMTYILKFDNGQPTMEFIYYCSFRSRCILNLSKFT